MATEPKYITGRYVIEFDDGFQVSTNKALKIARIYQLNSEGWPKKKDKPLQLGAESEDDLWNQLKIWRDLGSPQRDSVSAAIDARVEVGPAS